MRMHRRGDINATAVSGLPPSKFQLYIAHSMPTYFNIRTFLSAYVLLVFICARTVYIGLLWPSTLAPAQYSRKGAVRNGFQLLFNNI